MRRQGRSVMWRQWMIRVMETNTIRSKVYLKAFVDPKVEADARCLGYMSSLYGNPRHQDTCSAPPYGNVVFLNSTLDESEGSSQAWFVSPSDDEEVALKAGEDSTTVVIMWTHGEQSVPNAANPSFVVSCVPSRTPCNPSPDFANDGVGWPAGQTSSDVAGLTTCHNGNPVYPIMLGLGLTSSMLESSYQMQYTFDQTSCMCKHSATRSQPFFFHT